MEQIAIHARLVDSDEFRSDESIAGKVASKYDE